MDFGSDLWTTQYHNFAPSLGFAWQPFGNARTVIRGGAGIFYNAHTSGNGSLAIFYNPPMRNPQTYTSTNINPIVGFPNAYPAANAGTSSAPFGIAQNFKNATVNEWTFGIQHQLASNIVVDLTYFGSKGSHLPINRNINQPLPSGRGRCSSRQGHMPGSGTSHSPKALGIPSITHYKRKWKSGTVPGSACSQPSSGDARSITATVSPQAQTRRVRLLRTLTIWLPSGAVPISM